MVYPLSSLALHSEEVWSSVAGGGESESLWIKRNYAITVQTKTQSMQAHCRGSVCRAILVDLVGSMSSDWEQVFSSM